MNRFAVAVAAAFLLFAHSAAAKTTICHTGNGKTLTVGDQALVEHLAHGDTVRACSTGTCGDANL